MATTIARTLVNVGAKTVGDLVGNTIADTIFGSKKTIHGKRVHHINEQKMAEGESIPNVYGKVQLAGSIIWMSDVSEYLTVEKKRSKSSETSRTDYTYTVSLAIGLCEGPISSVGRIWADGVLIDKHNVRVYHGTEDQEPDFLLEAWYDDHAPAYRGLAYVMIQEFDITKFNNKIPNFTFEVCRICTDEQSIENLVESIVIIPGCGEFVYDPKVHSENCGGGIATVNQHHMPGVANSVVSLDQLRQTFPKVEWVAPVVSWFCSSLHTEDCKIIPKVEKKDVSYESEEWQVGDMKRKDAEEVLSVGGKLNYGGTPSDASIVRYLQHIKSRRLQVMFYPMLFVDTPGKPWRGRITANSGDSVRNFFNGEFGYNKFILHYANLVKGYTDAFLIGSEMQDLTKFKDENGKYVAVDELVKLAGQVKAILGDKVKVSYAANWGEYHSVNGEFYMDKLWASKDIDFVGIDAYFPLSDVRESQYDVKKIIAGWDNGELYDYYYDGNKKMTLSPEYAIKNIEFWWKNKHYNPDGNQSEWEPKMKKIWFTEYGFASISCATNEPNVFVDASTSESNLPKNSTGDVDILAQRVAIQGTEMRWRNSELIERRFLWTWDARPYPTWPQLKSVWSDGDSWQRGHWVNGKTGVMELRNVVKDICIKSGVDENLLDVENLYGIVHGMVVDSNYSAKNVLTDLQKVYNFDVYESDGKIKCVSRNSSTNHRLNYDDFLANYELDDIDTGDSKTPLTVESKSDIPGVVSINYITQDFSVKKCEFNGDDNSKKNALELDLPLFMSNEDAKNVARNIFRNTRDSNTTYSFILAINSVFGNDDLKRIQPGDVLKISYLGDELTMRVKNLDIREDNTVQLVCCRESGVDKYDLQLNFDHEEYNHKLYKTIPESQIQVIKIPNKNFIAIAGCGLNDKWYGCRLNYTTLRRDEVVSRGEVVIDTPTTIGSIIFFENNVKKFHFGLDNLSRLMVKLHHGQLFSVAKSNLFTQDKNMIMVGDEIMKFSDAKLQSDGSYILGGLVRGLYGTKTERFDRFVLLDKDSLKTIEIDAWIDKINLSVQTFLDKKQLRVSDIAQEKNFIVQNDLLHPVKLMKNGTRISWTPRVIQDNFWSNEVDHGFYIRFNNKDGNAIKQDYTDDFTYEIPENLRDVVSEVMIAVFKDNRVRSEFISLKL